MRVVLSGPNDECLRELLHEKCTQEWFWLSGSILEGRDEDGACGEGDYVWVASRSFLFPLLFANERCMAKLIVPRVSICVVNTMSSKGTPRLLEDPAANRTDTFPSQHTHEFHQHYVNLHYVLGNLDADKSVLWRDEGLVSGGVLGRKHM